MRKYGDMTYRAGRYVVEIRVNGHTPSKARALTKLPHILAAIMNKVIFDRDNQLRIELSKLEQYIDYCIWSYREYYRGKMKSRYEATH